MLNFYNNSLSGPLGPLPVSLSFLSTSINALTGTIPSDWALPPNLRELWCVTSVQGGTWRCACPACHLAEVSKQPHGSSYRVEGNKTHTLSPTPARCRLVGNYLKGTFPTSLVLPEGLEQLSVFANQLTGRVPTQLPLPKSLLNLDLSGNSFSGELPGDWQLPAGLQMLWCGRRGTHGWQGGRGGCNPVPH